MKYEEFLKNWVEEQNEKKEETSQECPKDAMNNNTGSVLGNVVTGINILGTIVGTIDGIELTAADRLYIDPAALGSKYPIRQYLESVIRHDFLGADEFQAAPTTPPVYMANVTVDIPTNEQFTVGDPITIPLGSGQVYKAQPGEKIMGMVAKVHSNGIVRVDLFPDTAYEF